MMIIFATEIVTYFCLKESKRNKEILPRWTGMNMTMNFSSGLDWRMNMLAFLQRISTNVIYSSARHLIKASLLYEKKWGYISCDRKWKRVDTFYTERGNRNPSGVYVLKVHYPTEFLLVSFGDGLALGVGSLAQNVDDDLFIRTESFHGSSPLWVFREKKNAIFNYKMQQCPCCTVIKRNIRGERTIYNAWASATGSKLAAGSTVGTSYTWNFISDGVILEKHD